MSMYVKLKRKNQTIFLHCEKDETIKNLKEKVTSINKVPIEDQALYINKEGDEALSDDTKLHEAKIQTDTILYLVYRDEDGQWESIELYNPELEDEEDELL